MGFAYSNAGKDSLNVCSLYRMGDKKNKNDVATCHIWVMSLAIINRFDKINDIPNETINKLMNRGIISKL